MMRVPAPIQTLLLYLSVHGEIRGIREFLREWNIPEGTYQYWRGTLIREGLISAEKTSRQMIIKGNKEATDNFLIENSLRPYIHNPRLRKIFKTLFETNIPQMVTLNLLQLKLIQFNRKSSVVFEILKNTTIKTLETLLCLPENINKIHSLKPKDRNIIIECISSLYPLSELEKINEALVLKLIDLRSQINRNLEEIIINMAAKEERSVYGDVRRLKEERILDVRNILSIIINYLA